MGVLREEHLVSVAPRWMILADSTRALEPDLPPDPFPLSSLIQRSLCSAQAFPLSLATSSMAFACSISYSSMLTLRSPDGWNCGAASARVPTGKARMVVGFPHHVFKFFRLAHKDNHFSITLAMIFNCRIHGSAYNTESLRRRRRSQRRRRGSPSQGCRGRGHGV